MVTAAATTNSIGSQNLGDPAFGDLGCSTGHSRVEPANTGSTVFFKQCEFELEGRYKLGDLLGGQKDDLDLIGRYIFDSGAGLNSNVWLFLHKHNGRIFEIRTGLTRYKVMHKRVYAKLLVRSYERISDG